MNKHRGSRRKISANQQQQLLQVFLHMGREESRRLCVEYGVCAEYAEKHASDIGKMPKRKYGRSRETPVRVVDHNDPRWAWAIERGAVTA